MKKASRLFGRKQVTTAIPVASRFWLQVWPRGDCWEWRGSIRKDGYGEFWDGLYGRTLAHRFAYFEAKGDVPKGLELDHICGHRWCVKPSHLEAVTRAENVRRGTGPRRMHAKTHCRRGHPYGISGGPGILRMCPVCWSESRQRSALKKKKPAQAPGEGTAERGDGAQHGLRSKDNHD